MARVVHIVIGKANPQRANGVNKVVHELASQQIKMGMHTEVWGLSKTPEVAADERSYKLKLFRFFLFPFRISNELCAEIATLKGDDIVHFHGTFMPPFYTITKRLHAAHVPWVITSHSHLMRHSLQKKKIAKKIYLFLFERFVLKNAKKVQAITGQEKMEMPAFLDKEKIACIPNGYTVQDIEIKKTPNPEPVFLYLGRFAKQQKGLDILLHAFATYKGNGYSGKLLLAGEGVDLDFLKTMAQALHLQDAVEFLGSVFGIEKQQLLQKADFFVCPSRWDVIPTAVLEAAANGLALIVSEETGFANFVRKWNCGYAVPAEDTDALSQAMTSAYSAWKSQELADMQKNAVRMIKEEFDMQKITGQINQELYQLVA